MDINSLIEKINDACGYLLVPALHSADVKTALNILMDTVIDLKDQIPEQKQIAKELSP